MSSNSKSDTPSLYNCLIQKDKDHLISLSEDMVQSIRRINQNLARCEQCDSFDNCPILREFNAHVSAAIQEISDEYNLAASIHRI